MNLADQGDAFAASRQERLAEEIQLTRRDA